jgi:hypothetical protein
MSCLDHPRVFYVTIRRSHLHLCHGDAEAAAVLAALEYWTDVSHKHGKGGWVFRTQDELSADTMSVASSAKVVRDRLRKLEAWGYVERRRNPKYRFDQTWQYRLDIDVLQAALDALADEEATGTVQEHPGGPAEKTLEAASGVTPGQNGMRRGGTIERSRGQSRHRPSETSNTEDQRAAAEKDHQSNHNTTRREEPEEERATGPDRFAALRARSATTAERLTSPAPWEDPEFTERSSFGSLGSEPTEPAQTRGLDLSTLPSSNKVAPT